MPQLASYADGRSIERQVQHGISSDRRPSQNAKQHHVAGRPSSVEKGMSMCLMALGKAFRSSRCLTMLSLL